MTTILLVDAPEGDASILASALRVEGYDVAIVSTAADARRVVAAGNVSLAVIDLMLRSEALPSSAATAEPPHDATEGPVRRTSAVRELTPARNGLELARELRASNPSMRVLLTSSYVLSERQLERADCGVSGFIPKPYELREVVEFIHTKVSSPPSSRRLWHAEVGSGVHEAPLQAQGGARGRR